MRFLHLHIQATNQQSAQYEKEVRIVKPAVVRKYRRCNKTTKTILILKSLKSWQQTSTNSNLGCLH